MLKQITPVTVFPGTATHLKLSDLWSSTIGQPPSVRYHLMSADQESLKNGEVRLTQEQWDSWDDSVPDLDYVATCVATILGLTLV